MPRTDRPAAGDGHTATSSLEPARCGCGAHLVVACEDHCGAPHPELGIVGAMDPIARLKAPKSVPRARGAPRRDVAQIHIQIQAPALGGTRQRLLDAIAAHPGTLHALADRLAMPKGRISFMLVQLQRAGQVAGALAPGVTRGMTYSLVQKNGGGA